MRKIYSFCHKQIENKREHHVEVPMTTRVKLKPGQKGTKSLVAEYGDALVCVRYRYDSRTRTRHKTVELIVESKPWSPACPRFSDSEFVPVRIHYQDTGLREQAKAAHGKWDPDRKVWLIPYGKLKGTELEKLIILETEAKS